MAALVNNMPASDTVDDSLAVAGDAGDAIDELPQKDDNDPNKVSFMVIPFKMIRDVSIPIPAIERRKKRGPAKKTFAFFSLSPEMIMTVMDCLPMTNVACLALSCKYLARLAVHHGALKMNVETAVLRHIRDPNEFAWHFEITDFFRLLNKGWVPKTLRYCNRCSKFRPRNDRAYWIAYGKQKVMKFGGLAGKHWASRLLDRTTTPQTLLSEEAKDGDQYGHLRLFTYWTVCPACTIENP